MANDAADRHAIVCPCHDVTLHDVKSMVRRGYTHPETLKRATGAFMGPCQGKYCAPIVRAVLADLTEAGRPQPTRPTVRAPLYPIRLGMLVDGDALVAAPGDDTDGR